ncbi:MAG: hypothetical protein IT238_09645 [Bacteroidia bacterium]|nr:hypothetical protein [Bacteroidia bacterium]MCZ2249567.1 hypothetical protein [Bacteroidia bacterium]
MKKLLFLLGIILFVFSCKSNQENGEAATKTDNNEFEMYQMSEMAALMERMFNENSLVKKKIEEGSTDLGVFPEDYLRIHTAELTDSTDFDEVFKVEAEKFIQAQKLVFSASDKHKENFNNMVSACINCHEQKCSGPIQRIKKLYIQ